MDEHANSSNKRCTHNEGVYGIKHCVYAHIDAPYVCGNSKQQTQTWHHQRSMWTTKRIVGKNLELGSNIVEKNLNLTNHVMRRPRTLNNKVVYHHWNPPTSYVTNRFPLLSSMFLLPFNRNRGRSCTPVELMCSHKYTRWQPKPDRFVFLSPDASFMLVAI